MSDENIEQTLDVESRNSNTSRRSNSYNNSNNNHYRINNGGGQVVTEEVPDDEAVMDDESSGWFSSMFGSANSKKNKDKTTATTTEENRYYDNTDNNKQIRSNSNNNNYDDNISNNESYYNPCWLDCNRNDTTTNSVNGVEDELKLHEEKVVDNSKAILADLENNNNEKSYNNNNNANIDAEEAAGAVVVSKSNKPCWLDCNRNDTTIDDEYDMNNNIKNNNNENNRNIVAVNGATTTNTINDEEYMNAVVMGGDDNPQQQDIECRSSNSTSKNNNNNNNINDDDSVGFYKFVSSSFGWFSGFFSSSKKKNTDDDDDIVINESKAIEAANDGTDGSKDGGNSQKSDTTFNAEDDDDIYGAAASKELPHGEYLQSTAKSTTSDDDELTEEDDGKRRGMSNCRWCVLLFLLGALILTGFMVWIGIRAKDNKNTSGENVSASIRDPYENGGYYNGGAYDGGSSTGGGYYNGGYNNGGYYGGGDPYGRYYPYFPYVYYPSAPGTQPDPSEQETPPSDYNVAPPVAAPVAAPVAPPSPPPVGPPLYIQRAVTFAAIGDAPYSIGQANVLERQLLSLNPNAVFLIHVGDIRANTGYCSYQQYEDAYNVLRKSPVPVFIVLGDNDYNDCNNPEEGLSYWKKLFVEFDTNWSHSFNVQREPGRPENFAFTYNDVLFIGLNIVGGDPVSQSEWQNRLQDEITWTKSLIMQYDLNMRQHTGRIVLFGHADPNDSHAIFFEELSYFIKRRLNNRIPMLYVNGDGHYWSYDTNFYGRPSLLRIMVAGEAKEPPTIVTVTATGDYQDVTQAFTYSRAG